MKIKTPKIKIKLPALLLIIFIIIVVAELFVLYLAFYQGEYLPQESKAEAQARVNLGVFEKTKQWFEERKNFVLPASDSKNPFLEYR